MSKSLGRFNNIKECIEIIFEATENLILLMKEETNKKRQNELLSLIYDLAVANRNFANFLKKKLPEYFKSNDIDIKFEQIIKDLKNGS